jgi:hypothetical protein
VGRWPQLLFTFVSGPRPMQPLIVYLWRPSVGTESGRSKKDDPFRQTSGAIVLVLETTNPDFSEKAFKRISRRP